MYWQATIVFNCITRGYQIRLDQTADRECHSTWCFLIFNACVTPCCANFRCRMFDIAGLGQPLSSSSAWPYRRDHVPSAFSSHDHFNGRQGYREAGFALGGSPILTITILCKCALICTTLGKFWNFWVVQHLRQNVRLATWNEGTTERTHERMQG